MLIWYEVLLLGSDQRLQQNYRDSGQPFEPFGDA